MRAADAAMRNLYSSRGKSAGAVPSFGETRSISECGSDSSDVGPSSELWGGLLDGTPALAAERACVDDYVRMEQLPAEQRAALRQAHAEGRSDQSEEHSAAEIAWRERQARAERAEAALPAGQRQALAAMRQKFPDIPIEVGDTSAYQAPV